MRLRQQTIKTAISGSGIGIHSGQRVNLHIHPAPPNHGIKFTRTDLPNRPCVSGHFNQVVDTSLATVVGNDGCIISTIEHLMAAFSALSIDNALVEVDAYEMPIMDGSARPFVELIQKAGSVLQDHPRWYIKVIRPIELKHGEKFIGLYPLDHFKISYTIEYAHPLIKRQTLCMDITARSFLDNLCSARTFGFLQEYETLKQFGLARGGSLENVVVIDKESILNPSGLRFKDELVRHKILDCIGDFSLLGMPLMAHVIAEKAGHAFNHSFIMKFFKERASWETCTLETESTADHSLSRTA